MNIQCFFSISKHITLIGKPFTTQEDKINAIFVRNLVIRKRIAENISSGKPKRKRKIKLQDQTIKQTYVLWQENQEKKVQRYGS